MQSSDDSLFHSGSGILIVTKNHKKRSEKQLTERVSLWYTSFCQAEVKPSLRDRFSDAGQ